MPKAARKKRTQKKAPRKKASPVHDVWEVEFPAPVDREDLYAAIEQAIAHDDKLVELDRRARVIRGHAKTDYLQLELDPSQGAVEALRVIRPARCYLGGSPITLVDELALVFEGVPISRSIVDGKRVRERFREGRWLVVAANFEQEHHTVAMHAAFRRAIAEGEPSARYEYARSLLAQGDAREALALVDEELRTAPDDADYLHVRGACLCSLGQREQAAAAWQRSIALDPKTPWPLRALADMYGRAKRHREAIEYARRAVALDGDDSESQYCLACAFALADDRDNALAYLAKAVALQPSIVDHARTDPDLDSLRAVPELARLLHAG